MARRARILGICVGELAQRRDLYVAPRHVDPCTEPHHVACHREDRNEMPRPAVPGWVALEPPLDCDNLLFVEKKPLPERPSTARHGDWTLGPWHEWLEVTPDRVFILRFPPDHSYAETVAAFDDVVRFSEAARSPYGFIIDFSRMTRSDARGRAHVTQREKTINAMPSVQTFCRGVAMVAHNPFQRGVLTAVNWFVDRPYPQRVFARWPEADAWVAEQMGIPYVLRAG